MTVAALCRVPRVRGRAIISILPSLVSQLSDETVFRVYVAEALRIAPQGGHLEAKYWDLIHPTPKEPDPDPDKMAAEIIRKAGLKIEHIPTGGIAGTE